MSESKQKYKNFVIIPARMASKRLPNKLALDIVGKTLIQRTWENCLKIPNIDGVFIATQENAFWNLCTDFGAKVLVPNGRPYNGTDMVIQAARMIDDDCRKNIINVQGEWASVDPADIDRMVKCLSHDSNKPEVASLFYHDVPNRDPSRVKVVMAANYPECTCWKALYFSRQPIPYRSAICCYHVGVYGYNDAFLGRYLEPLPKQSPSNIEDEELEQLYWLQHGFPIWMHKTKYTVGIDTQKDLDEYVKSFSKPPSRFKKLFSKIVDSWKRSNPFWV